MTQRICMVKVYVASIDKLLEGDYFEVRKKSVSEERKKKIDACKMKTDKARSLAAGLLLQFAWNSYKKKDSEMIEISYIENGKPVCTSDERFHFNLSHSGNYVACAVSEEAVGIDIQQVKKADLLIAKRFFLPEEYELIQQAFQKEQSEIFCKLWTGKESYMKYTGEGMSKMMNSFMVNMKGHYIDDKIKDEKIPIKWYADIPSYQVAVCSTKEEFSSKLIWVTF